MLDLSFFTTLKLGWLNAWIPAFGMVVIQLVYMAIFREVGKRAVDTSWYTPRDKFWAMVSTFLQISDRQHNLCAFVCRLHLVLS